MEGIHNEQNNTRKTSIHCKVIMQIMAEQQNYKSIETPSGAFSYVDYFHLHNISSATRYIEIKTSGSFVFRRK